MLTEALYRFNGNPKKNRNTICHNSSLCKWDFIFPSVWRELHTVHIYIYYISVCVCACHWWRKNNHCSTGALKRDLCSTRTPKIKTELSTGNPWAPYGPMASKNFMHLEHLEAMALGVQTYRTINKIIQNHPNPGTFSTNVPKKNTSATIGPSWHRASLPTMFSKGSIKFLR